MKKRRMIYQVRRDTVEDLIAHYDALGDYGGGRSLRHLAKQSGMALDENEIKRLTLEKRKYYNGATDEEAEQERAKLWDGSPQRLY